jgi:thioester reductase-like protein
LTGATGALGAHILNQLLDDPNVSKVYCLVRGADALGRVFESLKARGLNLPAPDSPQVRKLKAFATDNVGAPHLGLSIEGYEELASSATLIIHAAWPVNFNISLSSFRPQIAGVRNLLDLASTAARGKARVVFISSISTAFGMPTSSSGVTAVPESRILSLEYAAKTGYARSKLVAERICEAAASPPTTITTTNGVGQGLGLSVAILRVGQIAADSVNGIWNPKEHVPLLVRSAREVSALPKLYGYEGRCEWMPVDTVAATVLQLASKLKPDPNSERGGNSSGGASFYNVVPPHSFSWNRKFLPALRKAAASGLGGGPTTTAATTTPKRTSTKLWLGRIKEVGIEEWLLRLRACAKVLGDEAEVKLPAFKLADYYEQTYSGSRSSGRKENDDGDDECEGEGEGEGVGLRFENARACADSSALRTCPELSDVDIVRKMLTHWFASS